MQRPAFLTVPSCRFPRLRNGGKEGRRLTRRSPLERKERGMLDVLMVVLTVVAFGGLFALIAGLERV
jgi:hypothetical protein